MTYSIALAGSTDRTKLIAETFKNDKRFTLLWTLSPEDRKVGRKQELYSNPLHQWAIKHNLPSLRVSNKVNRGLIQDINNIINISKDKSVHHNSQLDLLIVVDFGYLIPDWLLNLPNMGSLNIHPSRLPDWRGSSPAIGALLNDSDYSGTTLMLMNNGLDTGPVIFQSKFNLNHDWTQAEYYQYAFAETTNWLTDKIIDYLQGDILPQDQPTQPTTPITKQLKRDDGFIPWIILSHLLNSSQPINYKSSATMADQLPSFLRSIWKFLLEKNQVFLKQANSTDTLSHLLTLPIYINKATKALSPWPGVWTIIPTTKGDKRLKILQSSLNANQQLQLDKVQLEGLRASTWNQIKNNLQITD